MTREGLVYLLGTVIVKHTWVGAQYNDHDGYWKPMFPLCPGSPAGHKPPIPVSNIFHSPSRPYLYFCLNKQQKHAVVLLSVVATDLVLKCTSIERKLEI